MNEEQLANILANHIDVLLEGEPLLETGPDEVAQLLPVAQDLAAAAPTPRPEFGPALKESLLGPTSGNGGGTGSIGSTFSNQIFLIVVGLLALVATLTLLIGAVILGVSRSGILGSPSPTSLPVQTQIAPPQPTRSPVSPAPPEEPGLPDTATDTLSLPTPSATAVLDILPQVTITVEEIEELPPAPVLVPGQDDGRSNDDDDGDSSGGGSSGDREDHHHDDDND